MARWSKTILILAPEFNTESTTNVSTLVETREMSLVFGRQTVLNRISLSIPRGQTVAIIGESGCGKTMLLKSLVGLLKPTSGKILFDGVDIHSLNDVDMTRLRRRFGFVFQNAALFDSMTIGQNVAFPMTQHGVPSGKNADALVLDRLAEVGLPDAVVVKRPAQLSGGMRKRVGLARALILEPDLILYDEPTTGLDPIMSDVINELIMRTRRKYPVTSVMVTHDMHSAKKVADRIIMLYPYSRLAKGESQVLFDGTPDEIDHTQDRRVRQFVRGEAGERLMEMRAARTEHAGLGDLDTLKHLDARGEE
jgi:phospholipid/cholesterol/gamma-HCH transport system ATP-binding protein